MRFMNSRLRLALIAASALLVPHTAVRAQQPGTTGIASIPFAFQIGSYHYPAGTYKVVLQGDHILAVRGNADAGLMEVNWDTAKHPAPTGELVFHRYGDQYFLRQMRFRGSTEFLVSPQTKEERKAQKQEVEAERSADPRQDPNVRVALADAPR